MFGKSSQQSPQHVKDLGADGPLDSRILKVATQGKSVQNKSKIHFKKVVISSHFLNMNSAREDCLRGW